MERKLDVQQGDWLRGNCVGIVGFTAGRVVERELWSDSWMYSRVTD